MIDITFHSNQNINNSKEGPDHQMTSTWTKKFCYDSMTFEWDQPMNNKHPKTMIIWNEAVAGNTDRLVLFNVVDDVGNKFPSDNMYLWWWWWSVISLLPNISLLGAFLIQFFFLGSLQGVVLLCFHERRRSWQKWWVSIHSKIRNQMNLSSSKITYTWPIKGISL